MKRGKGSIDGGSNKKKTGIRGMGGDNMKMWAGGMGGGKNENIKINKILQILAKSHSTGQFF